MSQLDELTCWFQGANFLTVATETTIPEAGYYIAGEVYENFSEYVNDTLDELIENYRTAMPKQNTDRLDFDIFFTAILLYLQEKDWDIVKFGEELAGVGKQMNKLNLKRRF